MKMLLGLCIAATAFAAEAPLPAAKGEIPRSCRPSFPPGAPTDKSLYLIESKWTSDVGKTIPLSVLRRRPQIVTMFFTRCESACPILMNDMKKRRAALVAAFGKLFTPKQP
jgi:protein SCO1/2